MRIVGPNFFVGVHFKDGKVIKADRPVSYMRNWSASRVLALAKRWGWKVEFGEGEQAQLDQGSRGDDTAHRQSA
jgi:hypothetical protein